MIGQMGMVAKMAMLSFVLVAVAAAGVGMFSFYGFRQELIQHNIDMQGDEVAVEAKRFVGAFREQVKDVNFLAHTPPISGIRRASDNDGIDPVDRSTQRAWFDRLEQIFEQFIAAKSDYVAIEFVYPDGQRMQRFGVRKLGDRVERLNLADERSEWQALLDKLKLLPDDRSYLSGIELMRDRGRLIEPQIPVVSAFTPVHAVGGKLVGFVALRMRLDRTFSEMRGEERAGGHIHLLANADGEYLYHPVAAKSFAFEFGESNRIQDEFPELGPFYQRADGADNGQLMARDDGTRLVMAYQVIRLDEMADDDFILLVDAKPYSVVVASVNEVAQKSAAFIISIVVVGGLLAMWLARRQIEPIKTLERAILSFSQGDTASRLPLDREDEIGVLAKAFSDMTQQVQERNDELQRSEERFRQFAEHINDVFWVADAEGEVVHYVSPAFEHIWGVPCEEACGDPGAWYDAIHPDDKPNVVGPALKRLGMEFYSEEFRLIRGSGDERWINNRSFLVRDAEQQVVRVIGVAKDVSDDKETERRLSEHNEELKRINDKLHQAQDQLLQSEKMASVGQLAAGVAHEINNPAGYVNSNLGTLNNYMGDLLRLLEFYEASEASLPTDKQAVITEFKNRIEFGYLKQDVQELIKESLEGITRLKNIVQDLKDFSRVDEAEWQWADLHKGIDSTLNIVNNELKYKAEVIKEYGVIPEVECIASQINQVVMNILVNAAQAIDEHGTITIRTGVKNDDWIWIRISDTGKGIPQENIRRIFDPFFTTKPVGQGTGLGMSLCYSIVEKHEGWINVESEVGKGTTFTVNLPVQQKAPKAE